MADIFRATKRALKLPVQVIDDAIRLVGPADAGLITSATVFTVLYYVHHADWKNTRASSGTVHTIASPIFWLADMISILLYPADWAMTDNDRVQLYDAEGGPGIQWNLYDPALLTQAETRLGVISKATAGKAIETQAKYNLDKKLAKSYPNPKANKKGEPASKQPSIFDPIGYFGYALEKLFYQAELTLERWYEEVAHSGFWPAYHSYHNNKQPSTYLYRAYDHKLPVAKKAQAITHTAATYNESHGTTSTSLSTPTSALGVYNENSHKWTRKEIDEGFIHHYTTEYPTNHKQNPFFGS